MIRKICLLIICATAAFALGQQNDMSTHNVMQTSPSNRQSRPPNYGHTQNIKTLPFLHGPSQTQPSSNRLSKPLERYPKLETPVNSNIYQGQIKEARLQQRTPNSYSSINAKKEILQIPAKQVPENALRQNHQPGLYHQNKYYNNIGIIHKQSQSPQDLQCGGYEGKTCKTGFQCMFTGSSIIGRCMPYHIVPTVFVGQQCGSYVNKACGPGLQCMFQGRSSIGKCMKRTIAKSQVPNVPVNPSKKAVPINYLLPMSNTGSTYHTTDYINSGARDGNSLRPSIPVVAPSKYVPHMHMGIYQHEADIPKHNHPNNVHHNANVYHEAPKMEASAQERIKQSLLKPSMASLGMLGTNINSKDHKKNSELLIGMDLMNESLAPENFEQIDRDILLTQEDLHETATKMSAQENNQPIDGHEQNDKPHVDPLPLDDRFIIFRNDNAKLDMNVDVNSMMNDHMHPAAQVQMTDDMNADKMNYGIMNHHMDMADPMQGMKSIFNRAGHKLQPQDINLSTIPTPHNSNECDGSLNYHIDGQDYLVTAVKGNCKTMSWNEALDFCNSKSMSLVSLGNSVDTTKAQKILDIARIHQDAGFWTGGYIYHPNNHRVPNIITWLSDFPDTDIIQQGKGYFSQKSKLAFGTGQPDNYEHIWNVERGVSENLAAKEHCVAMMYNHVGSDGAKLHDLACYHKLHAVCEKPKMPQPWGLNIEM